MLKSSSLKKLTAMSVGLVIALSSCGLQNTASESSGSSTAAGKTKNSALGEWCYRDAVGSPMDLDEKIDWGLTKRWWADFGTGRYRWQAGKTWITDKYGPDIVPCSWTNYGKNKPADVQLFDAGNPVGVSAPPSPVSVKACVKPDIKEAMLKGYEEQANRPLGGEVTEAYLAQMKKGLEITKVLCTN